MREVLFIWFITWLSAMVSTTVVAFLVAIDEPEKFCANKTMHRVEYIVPSRIIGCWLGERI
jgi:hypothetical protein